MGTLYIDTGGSTTNSGSTDSNSASLTGTNATVATATITLDGSPDLSGLITTGTGQSSIHISQATNANRKIFWINAFDNGAKTVTVDVAVTGVTGSNWSIGGRHVLTNASIEGALRAGDTVIFNNSPAAAAATMWTFRNAGTSASGMAKIMGKAGVRPVLNTTNTSNCVDTNSLFNVAIENLEIDQDGATGVGILMNGSMGVVENVKVVDAGGFGIEILASSCKVIKSEISGTGDSGVRAGTGSAAPVLFGNYIHDVTTEGFRDTVATSSGQFFCLFNIIDTCGDRGIYQSGSVAGGVTFSTIIMNNTIYGCGNSGVEFLDGDCSCGIFMNNILMDNGNAAGEFNYEHAAGNAEGVGVHEYNIFSKSSNNVQNLTIGSSELTSDPLFNNAASGDFSLSSSSPAKAAGYPGVFLGGSTGYLDIGAVQRQETSSGGSFARTFVI